MHRNSYFRRWEYDVKSEVLIGSPTRRIVEEAQNWKADLIVAGSHGYGLWERMMLGSNLRSIRAACAVFRSDR